MSARSPRRFVVAVTGLAAEARIARAAGVRAVCGGLAVTRLTDALASEIRIGAAALISFGIAGALTADLTAGDCVIGRAVASGGVRVPADSSWLARLAARIPEARIGDVAGVDSIVGDRSAKRELHVTTAACVVDMESHVVARLAQAHALPFAVFRVVCDPVERTLPAAAGIALTEGGRIDVRAVLRSIARSPAQLAPLTAASIDVLRALRALSRARGRLGDGLGYPNLGELLLDVV